MSVRRYGTVGMGAAASHITDATAFVFYMEENMDFEFVIK